MPLCNRIFEMVSYAVGDRFKERQTYLSVAAGWRRSIGSEVRVDKRSLVSFLLITLLKSTLRLLKVVRYPVLDH